MKFLNKQHTDGTLNVDLCDWSRLCAALQPVEIALGGFQDSQISLARTCAASDARSGPLRS